MSTAIISRWARRFLLAGVSFLIAAQLATLAGFPRRVEIVLGLQGFVLTVVFGKAYSLIPSYFDRTLAIPHAPAVHLPIQFLAVVALAVAPLDVAPAWAMPLGVGLWALGTLVFVAAIGATVAPNLLGRETGTSDASSDRAPLDRVANPFMPVAVLYLLAGSYELLAGQTPLPTLLDGSPVRVSHLLAAGFALLLLFSVGYRLLPRFLVATTPRALALVVLPAGAVGPSLLAIGYPAGPTFVAGALLESLAVLSFAVSYAWLFVRTDRDRVGFYGPLGGLAAGCIGVALGLQFALVGLDADLIRTHLRLNVFGLLGLSIAGVLYQFYPPGVATWWGASDRTAFWSLVCYAGGLLCFALAPFVGVPLAALGHAAIALAAGVVLYLVAGAIRMQTAGR